MPLESDVLLELADGVSITRKNASFKVSIGHVQIQGGRYTLPILDAFSSPRTLSQALKDLEVHIGGTAGWVELISHVKSLHEVGALVEPNDIKAPRRAHDKRFDSASVHIRMLNDERRTSSFQSAIRRAVKPGRCCARDRNRDGRAGGDRGDGRGTTRLCGGSHSY